MGIDLKVNNLPKKSLGQNFLIDKNICRKILKEINIENKIILEIGPGYGFLTDYIIKNKPKKLILIEKDNQIYNFLKNKYSTNDNLEIYNNDILKYDLSKFKNISIISNMPYNISSELIDKIMINSNYISFALLMLQKEVAHKYDYSRKKLNKYKFFTKLCSDYKICFNVSRNVFYPKPKVNSCIVKFDFKKNNIDWNKTKKFTQEIFSNKRKVISNNISIKNLDSSIKNKRVENLNIEEIIKIYKVL